jgi:hypothetical protein
MKVKIRCVVDGNNHKNEMLVIDVIEDTDMGQYLVMDSTYNPDGTVSNKFRHIYWFPPKKVKKGDVVVLYTKPGNYSMTKKGNNNIHYFHWNVENCVWNNDGDNAVVIHYDEVNKKSV